MLVLFAKLEKFNIGRGLQASLNNLLDLLRRTHMPSLLVGPVFQMLKSKHLSKRCHVFLRLSDSSCNLMSGRHAALILVGCDID